MVAAQKVNMQNSMLIIRSEALKIRKPLSAACLLSRLARNIRRAEVIKSKREGAKLL